MTTTISKTDKPAPSEIQSINIQLKAQIKFLLNKITTFIPSNQTNNCSITITTQTNSSENKAKNNLLNDLPYDQQISIYQKSIDLIKSKLIKMNLIQIESYEKAIKAEEEVLHNLQSDYNIFLNQCNRNKQRYNTFTTLQELKTNIYSKNESCKELRQDIKHLKQVYNQSIQHIKQQEKELIALNDTCIFIRNNIEFQYYNPNNGIDTRIDTQVNLESLITMINTLQKDVEIEEKSYVNEVNRQQIIINDLKNEINMISLKVNQMHQKQRIEDIKMKEKNKYYKLNHDKSIPLLPATINDAEKKLIRLRSVSPMIANKNELKMNKSVIESYNNKGNSTFIDNKHKGHYKINSSHIQTNTECGNSPNFNKIVIYRKLNLNNRGEQQKQQQQPYQKYNKNDKFPLMTLQEQPTNFIKSKEKKTDIISYKIHKNTIVHNNKTIIQQTRDFSFKNKNNIKNKNTSQV